MRPQVSLAVAPRSSILRSFVQPQRGPGVVSKKHNEQQEQRYVPNLVPQVLPGSAARRQAPHGQSQVEHKQSAHHGEQAHPNPQQHGNANQQLRYPHRIAKKDRMREREPEHRLIEIHRSFLDIAIHILLIAAVSKSVLHEFVLGEEEKHDAYYNPRQRHGLRRFSSCRIGRAFSLRRFCFCVGVGHWFLNTFPSFMTKLTFLSASMLASGSPCTAITSAYAPGATTPSSPRMSRRSAALVVADLIASIGAMPNLTMWLNSWAIGSVQGIP